MSMTTKDLNPKPSKQASPKVTTPKQGAAGYYQPLPQGGVKFVQKKSGKAKATVKGKKR